IRDYKVTGVQTCALPIFDYASARYGSPFREFRYIESIESLDRLQGPFDCITLIEVLEHLDPAQVRQMLSQVSRLLGPGGRLVIRSEERRVGKECRSRCGR